MSNGLYWTAADLRRKGYRLPQGSSTATPSRLALIVPFPPSTWQVYAQAGSRKVLTKIGREYKQAVIQAAMLQLQRPLMPLRGRVRMVLEFHEPDNRRRDVADNFSKVLLDAFTEAGIYEDDSQIDDFHVVRATRSQPGYVAVLISGIDES